MCMYSEMLHEAGWGSTVDPNVQWHQLWRHMCEPLHGLIQA